MTGKGRRAIRTYVMGLPGDLLVLATFAMATQDAFLFLVTPCNNSVRVDEVSF